MPRLGGEADKFGNRYESLWVVDAALDLINGEYADLVLEPVGDEAAGIEFYRITLSGIREYHSIKRQQSNGNWTINRLMEPKKSGGRSILGDLIAKIQEGAEGVFSSGTSASELEELTERAQKSESLKEFQERISESGRLSGRFHHSLVPSCGNPDAVYTALRCLRVRTKNERELTKDVERRIRSIFRMKTERPLDATSVRLLIADFATGSLGTTLTSDSFLTHLNDHGICLSSLTGDRTINERMQQLNRLYLQEIGSLLINGAQIKRSESGEASRTMLEDGKSVMLEGGAGSGKSCILAQVLEELHRQEVPSLVIRLDRLTEADHSAQGIGTRRGLPDSPTITLGELAGDRPSVLCIDQLDALSIVSARQQSAWDAFQELLGESRNYPSMRILFACRSFDLEQDPQLRSLVADAGRVARIAVEELKEEDICSAIETSRLETEQLNSKQLRILQVPLHLYLFLEIAPSGRSDFTSRGDLFDAFWDYKKKRVDTRLNWQGSSWTVATTTLCQEMSKRESLVAPVYVMDHHQSAMEAMASETVVYIQDEYVRFFHETFFDYSFARTFLRENNDLVEWLIADEQHLFRRSQVRQVLTFLRDRDQDRDRYLCALRDLLGHPDVRFHIKKLVLNWLGALRDPTPEEWTIIEGLMETLEGHSWTVIHNSVPWFDLLQDMGRWKTWLNADDQQVDRAIGLLRTPDVLEARSAAIAGLASPFRGRSEEWRGRLRYLVQAGWGFTSPGMKNLVIRLISDGTLDDARPGRAINDDWWSIWFAPSTKTPEFTAKVLGAWFDRQLQRATELQSDNPFNGSPTLVSHSQLSERVIKECAARAPREFIHEIFPRYTHFDKSIPKQRISAPSMSGTPDEQLRNALAEAMISLANEDPSELDAIMNSESLSDSKWMDSIVLRALSANPSFYVERIVSFLLDRPAERLCIGYDLSSGEDDTFVAVSRTAIAAASSLCSHDSFVQLENAILQLRPNWEKKHRQFGRTELALLRALPQERVRKATRQRIQELERRFPKAAERGAPKPPAQDIGLSRVPPPVPVEAQCRMTDDQWLSAMAKYRSDGSTMRDGQLVGGAEELSQGLSESARKQPARFAALADRMDSTYSPIYFKAILEGLTGDEGGLGRAGTVQEISSVLRRIRDLGVSVRGADIAWAVKAVADEDLPKDILEMVCLVALEDPDPEEDHWRRPDVGIGPIDQAYNSARGAAADALASFLFADTRRWDSVKPTIEQLITDRVMAVRSTAVECLLAILDSHRGDALAFFQKLASEADPILSTHTVGRFISYAMFRDYPAIRPTLFRMLASSSSATVRAGASQVILATLWVDEASGDESAVLEMGEEARAGAARIYAENLSDKMVGDECDKRLRTFFRDESEAVRKEASHCWSTLEPDEIAARGSLIGAFAQSMGSGSDIGSLAYRLEDTRQPLPVQVCDLAESAITAFGPKASSFRFEEAGIADMLAKLMVRLHKETNDPILRKRVLDTIDEMVKAGFMGIDEQLKQNYDR